MSARLRNIALLAVLTIVVAAGASMCKLTVTGKETQAISELADVKGHAARVKREMSEIRAGASQHDWLKQLGNGSGQWLSALDSILARIPANVWLNRVESSSKDSTITIEGNSTSFEAVSRLVNSLRLGGSFGDVQLRSARLSGTTNAACVDFTILVKTGSGKEAPPNAGQPALVGSVPALQGGP